MTMNDIGLNRINYLAVVVAAAAAMVIGAVWYAPGVFGMQWMALAGFTAPPEESMTQAYALGFVNALIKALILALLIDWMKAGSWLCGALTGLVCWIGFAATVRADAIIFGGRPPGLFWIDGGYDLVSYVVMGAIIGAWLKKRA